MKVLCVPHVSHLGDSESGIHTVVRKWFKHGREAGIDFVNPDANSIDVLAIHAGMTKNKNPGGPTVAVLHGLYFTGDYEMGSWAYSMNANIVDSIRHSRAVTVPSPWVGEILRRDMRFAPAVVPHGIDVAEWQHNKDNAGFVVAYAKNRDGIDVCDSTMSVSLAKMCPDIHFAGTFGKNAPSNYKVTGVIPYDTMKDMVQRAAVFVSPAKETFGIAALEAVAAGTPVLTANHGGVIDFVRHGVNGYCYRPGDMEDMERGLRYCLKYRDALSANCREFSPRYSWPAAMDKLRGVFEEATWPTNSGVSVIIPVYNKEPEELNRAIKSVLDQTVSPRELIIVDDGSKEDFVSVYRGMVDECVLPGGGRVVYHRQPNAGVAVARNNGIALSSSDHIICLDADDWLAPRFIEATVPALQADNGLGIAYTGLTWHKPDGSTGLSQWPGEWDFDQQLKKRNQVPTCCMFKREMWERLGGYKQRYAPGGAGTEDAEFWLRSGAYGWRAEKVTNEGLFHYSWLSGATSRKDYRETSWTDMHPWTVDGIHPFASYATPKKFSHPVYQYDEPTVSVIIPVGPGHREHVEAALDSLESQTFRNWEAIVIMDEWGTPDEDAPMDYQNLRKAYPYARFVDTGHRMSIGAGAARNLGVKNARAPFLLFLDADDCLYPEFLEKTLQVWKNEQAAVYTDYIGVANVGDPDALSGQLKKNLLSYDSKKQLAAIRHNAADYDCNKAVRQPENPPFIWCNVTTLLPKAWHDEIGGFDENMVSWEDVDYFYRLAWAGKCFTRVPEPLMVYRFHSGSRRESGLGNWQQLIEYISKKKEGLQIMGCKSCGKKSASSPQTNFNVSSRQAQGVSSMNDQDYVMVKYIGANRGMHPVYGSDKRFYGYRVSGDEFLVHKSDIKSYPHLFQAATTTVTPPRQQIAAPPPPPQVWIPAELEDEPVNAVINKAIDERRFDPQALPGITPTVATRLEEAGVNSPDKVRKLGLDGLTAVKGIGEARAKAILEYVDTVYGSAT